MKKYGPLVIVIGLMLAAWLGGLNDFVTLDNFHNHKQELRQFVVDHYVASLIGFALLYVFVTMASIPIASLLTFAGGFLYGVPVATMVIVCAATIGATCVFLIAKSSVGESLRHKAQTFYAMVEKDMKANAFFYMLSLRLVPLFPFFIVNILPAFFNVKTRDYSIATFIGILPGTIIYTNVGRSLGEVHNPADLISSDMVLAFVLLGVLAMTPVMIKKYKAYKKVN